MVRRNARCIWCDRLADVVFFGLVFDTYVCSEHEMSFGRSAVDNGLQILDKQVIER